MANASEIKHAEELLQLHLIEWRDAGGHVESVTGAILQLIVARERFAEAVGAAQEANGGMKPTCQNCGHQPCATWCSSQVPCALCHGTKQTYPAGSFEAAPCPKCCDHSVVINDICMSKKITLQAWAASRYDPPPSAKTLRRWARDCWIFPIPQKVGREYRVDDNARFIGPNHENIYGDEAA